jgi:hypothetical protein
LTDRVVGSTLGYVGAMEGKEVLWLDPAPPAEVVRAASVYFGLGMRAAPE